MQPGGGGDCARTLVTRGLVHGHPNRIGAGPWRAFSSRVRMLFSREHVAQSGGLLLGRPAVWHAQSRVMLEDARCLRDALTHSKRARTAKRRNTKHVMGACPYLSAQGSVSRRTQNTNCSAARCDRTLRTWICSAKVNRCRWQVSADCGAPVTQYLAAREATPAKMRGTSPQTTSPRGRRFRACSRVADGERWKAGG